MDQIKIAGITYQAEPTARRNIHSGEPLFCLTKIGKRGKPVSAYRWAALRTDGTWHLGAWA